MAAAIALAVVLIIAVAGMSLAMQTQNPVQGQTSRIPRSPRTPPMPGRRVRDRRPTPPPAPAPPPPPPPASVADISPRVPELLKSGIPTRARVVNVVDERVVGPVTRSRLTLRIEPEGEDGFEVNIRHAFPTSEARGKVKVGGTIAVRYDRAEHRKVVLDPDSDG
jgi:hypothetical protein